MKLVIFGATGKTGQHLVEQALAQGHEVSAFVRNETSLTLNSDKLQIAKGDILDYSSVVAAIAGSDAVLSALGVVGKKTILSEGTRNIIKAMEQTRVKRLIVQSGLGVGDSHNQLNQMGFVFAKILLPIFLKATYADKERQEEFIRQSRLDWTIVRPAVLTDGSLTGNYRSGFGVTDKGIKGQISRADVADFMLKQFATSAYLRKTPALSY